MRDKDNKIKIEFRHSNYFSWTYNDLCCILVHKVFIVSTPPFISFSSPPAMCSLMYILSLFLYNPSREVLLLEKVWCFPSFGKLQQIVCERRDVLRNWSLCFVWRWRSRRSRRAPEGRLACSESVWGWWGVTCSQCFVCVFTGSPIYEPLQGRREGRAQTFRRQAARQRI